MRFQCEICGESLDTREADVDLPLEVERWQGAYVEMPGRAPAPVEICGDCAAPLAYVRQLIAA